MARCTLATGSGLLTAECDDEFVEQANDLLKVVASFEKRGRGLANGVRVQFGWSELTLRHDTPGEITLYEPDFDGDPMAGDLRSDLTCTLAFTTDMVGTIKALGVEPIDLRYDDVLVIAKDCLELNDLYMLRSPPRGDDCGWYIGPVENPPEADDTSAFEKRYVWHLLLERPELMQVLTLPPGYLVIFSGEDIVSVTPPNGEEV